MGEALLKADEIKDIEISRFKRNKSCKMKDTKVRRRKETVKKEEKDTAKDTWKNAVGEELSGKKDQKAEPQSRPELGKSPETSASAGEADRGDSYRRGSMQRSVIIEKLRQEGCRITRQRKIILNIILEEDCTCCKEIYFLATKQDPNIGMATIYRMVNLLEKIGALKHRRAYHIYGGEETAAGCRVFLDDKTCIRLESDTLRNVIEKGMQACGYLNNRKVISVSLGNSEY